jgi:site-specific DNA-methyltransferase (adenine-specific)
MAQVERIGDCDLYLADCREVLPTVEADALITDPVWPNCPKNMLQGADNPLLLWEQTWAVMPDIKRSVVVMRHDSDPRFNTVVTLTYARAVILPYVMPGYIGRWLGGDEIAYCFGDPIPSRPNQRVIPGRAPLVQPDGRKANGHPCSRSLVHFRFLVRWWSEPNETVLDPFMGSGTTGVACATLGRKFIGIEVEQNYFDIACRRIEDAYRQADFVTQIEMTDAMEAVDG